MRTETKSGQLGGAKVKDHEDEQDAQRSATRTSSPRCGAGESRAARRGKTQKLREGTERCGKVRKDAGKHGKEGSDERRGTAR